MPKYSTLHAKDIEVTIMTKQIYICINLILKFRKF